MSTRHASRAVAVLTASALGVAVLGGGSLLAEPDAISGQALAAPVPHRPQATAEDWSWLNFRMPARPAPQRAAQQPRRDAAPAPASAPRPRPQSSATPGQRPGSIVLAEGGTARLVRAEVGDDGTLPIPNGVGEATWWGVGLGAKRGATVFAGHVNWAGSTGPFAELWQANRGDRVAVVDATGRTWAFRVQQVLTLSKHDLPERAVELFGPDGPHRAVLVTCGGRWVGGSDGYASNRVVVAAPAG